MKKRHYTPSDRRRAEARALAMQTCQQAGIDPNQEVPVSYRPDPEVDLVLRDGTTTERLGLRRAMKGVK